MEDRIVTKSSGRRYLIIFGAATLVLGMMDKGIDVLLPRRKAPTKGGAETLKPFVIESVKR